jgi:hypothetical protein
MKNLNHGYAIWALALVCFLRSAVASPFSLASRASKCLPPIPAYSANITFLGCYTDADTRTLPVAIDSAGGDNDPQSCGNSCGQAGYTYAGVEYSRSANVLYLQ